MILHFRRNPAQLQTVLELLDAKAIHYTEGGPWFPEYRFCDYHDVWKEKLFEMMNQRT